MNQWFRLYSEFASDPKVQSMGEIYQRRLIMLFCLRCGDVLVTLSEQEVAFALRITADELDATKQIFIQKGFINPDWTIRNWEKRQFSSDSSTLRTRAWRERSSKQDGDKAKRHGDALEQIQNRTDTEQKESAEALDHFSTWSENQYARHPKKKDKFESLLALKSAFASKPDQQITFEKNHTLWCRTDSWCEKGGSFAPSLKDFIINDGWKYAPVNGKAPKPPEPLRPPDNRPLSEKFER